MQYEKEPGLNPEKDFNHQIGVDEPLSQSEIAPNMEENKQRINNLYGFGDNTGIDARNVYAATNMESRSGESYDEAVVGAMALAESATTADNRDFRIGREVQSITDQTSKELAELGVTRQPQCYEKKCCGTITGGGGK